MIVIPDELIDQGACARHDSDPRTGDKTWVWLSEEEKEGQRRAYREGLRALFGAMTFALDR
jgi:hypothetical protein